ncbi:MAG: serine hydrolase [bacterium]|nr:MAG: serine hydrolase [bacterium]
MKYADPRDAGFSPEKLKKAKQYWDSIQSTACMIVHDGAVVAAWGDIERRFMCHSVRKSLLSALYGIYVDAGVIDTKKTLEEMGIDDSTPLTNQEKQARIVDLLKSASGVYLPAASEPLNARKPPRGSHEPGDRMYYNNWDFNALGTIFETETKTDLFREFERRIAEPIQMQDFRRRDGHYSYQMERSTHPAYIFRMSARDLARFGLLYLNKGVWIDLRIISESWVKQSTSKQIDANRAMGYGYLWWVYKKKPYSKKKMYSALGVGEQALEIVPSEKLVIVLRTDTFAHKNVSRSERLDLIRLILEAKCERPSKEPELIPLPKSKMKMETISITKSDKDFLRTEPLIQTENSIYEDGDELILKTPYGNFGIMKTRDGTLIIEDKYQEVIIERTADNTLKRIVTEWSINEEGKYHLDDGRLDEAISVFKKATDCYPNSTIGYCNLGETYSKSGMKEEAISSYEKAGRIDPENREAIVELRKLKFLMPDGMAAEWAKDYFHAFNAPDSTEYIKYLNEYYSESSLEKRPLEERLANRRALIEEFGAFECLYAVEMSDKEIYILARDLNSHFGWVFRFKMKEEDKKGEKEAALSGPHPPYMNEKQILEIARGEW